MVNVFGLVFVKDTTGPPSVVSVELILKSGPDNLHPSKYNLLIPTDKVSSGWYEVSCNELEVGKNG